MDILTIRRQNLLTLYSQFVANAQKEDPAGSMFGIDKQFADLIQIANSSLSAMKKGSRNIGPRLARQIEAISKKPRGWLDQEHSHDKASLQEVEREKFLKLATRAFKKASAEEKLRLIESMRQSLQSKSTTCDL